ncbi:flagellar motor switch protein FliM [Liquorilactobacillus satsumensis]|uniref:Flagellar motor switch protein FliM n=2 Tax=Liquorilactobacillus satsumensis TaxID=259059 RepID=A0A0R1V0J3_9LACO|nr:flagellar motor switch protein FliM [Liquorilactobacillus satsumensis]AJA34288.1 flagellar motor switch protein FliM [Liquorilactobacillus satsumensis]KRL99135.1 flagellar motor switch protein FliM [Liquorilactobacillus satsumensis DSM 16230 = JCM 12392]MCC7666619.1 flagellar motor switch protein FliM [Liquorilactobacillus satsumensis]MCP9312850.1 flagellar motor switch protein FliM [Liquorilactobacillus satsumensis]MCP9329259.1 flagellar motor switch protein FliM [Liquorilactobacillus sats
MDQVLTQQEIDSLLKAMDNGEISQEEIEEENDAVKVKSYDFRRPTKLSKEYVNTLHMIFEDFSKVSSNTFSTLLRTNANFQLASIEQVSYDEFVHSIPRVTLIGQFHSEPLKGVQLLEMNPQLCMLLVELLCGGPDGKKNIGALDKIDEKKEFTDIELAVLEEVVQEFGKIFQNVWSEIVKLETKVEGLSSNPQLLQNMSPNEPVIMVTFTANIAGVATFVNLCIPYVFFDEITDKLSFRSWFDTSHEFDASEEKKLQKGMNDVKLQLEVLLGNAQLELANLLHLEVGDVIKLDRKITEPLNSYIEGSPFYRVKLGKKNQQLAVELIDKLEGEQDNE